MIRLAYFYLGLPYLIFLIGWLHWYISIPISIFFVYALYCSIGSYVIDNKIIDEIRKQSKLLYLILFLLIVYLFFSGIGGYSFQNEDHHYRSAVFQDLINNQWPVVYQIKGFASENPLEGKQTFLVYYLGYWLPAAVAGKILGIKVGSFILYLWTVIGISLVLYFLCKYFNRFSIKIFWLFIAWGTLYFIGTFYTFPIKEILKGNAYLWAGNLLFADGNTGLIYWTFNQTIVPWLIILLIINQMNPKNILFLSSILFFYGPFAFIGFLSFIAYFVYKNDFSKAKLNNIDFKKFGKYLSFENVGGSFSVMAICYFYFASNSSGNVFNIVLPEIKTYLIFIFLSIGIISILLFDRYKTDLLFYLILFVLLILPFFQLGFGLDLTARASIPAMFILMLLAGEYLLKAKNGIRKNLVILYLIVAGLGHNMQFIRSVYFTSLEAASQTNLGETLSTNGNPIIKNIGDRLLVAKDKNLTIQNNLGTLKNPNNVLVRNFMGLTDQSIFYKYLAKSDGK